MRKIVLALAAFAMFATPAITQPVSIDATKFYIHFPIEAEDHDLAHPIFAAFHPFDTKEACDKFRTSEWSKDAEFKEVVTDWANAELDAHNGEVNFLPSYCWRPADGLRDGPKASLGGSRLI